MTSDGYREVSYPQPDVAIQTHGPKACEGFPCCIHAPSEHHMLAWPLVHRTDKPLKVVDFANWTLYDVVLSSRVCEHAQEHPDPDSLAYLGRRFSVDVVAAARPHDCDGCCRENG